MVFNIIELSPNGLGFKKTIDVYEGLDLFFSGKEGSLENFKSQNKWLYANDIKELINQVSMRVEINNMGDFNIWLMEKLEKGNHLGCKSLFYFESHLFESS